MTSGTRSLKNMARRTGRRPGKQDTRAAIVTSARAAFAERGFDATTIRQVATDAGVDPALVHHYFGTKDDLFLAVLELPIDPGELLEHAISGHPDDAGERLVRTFVTAWDSPVGSAGAALLRSAVSNPMAARLFREFVFTRVARRLAPHLDVPEDEIPLRTSLVASQIAGLAIVRYILAIEPLASAPPETIVATVGPTVQRDISGELPPEVLAGGA